MDQSGQRYWPPRWSPFVASILVWLFLSVGSLAVQRLHTFFFYLLAALVGGFVLLQGINCCTKERHSDSADERNGDALCLFGARNWWRVDHDGRTGARQAYTCPFQRRCRPPEFSEDSVSSPSLSCFWRFLSSPGSLWRSRMVLQTLPGCGWKAWLSSTRSVGC